LAYAGIPYQVFGQRSGALASTIAWSRLAMARSDPFIAAIAASRSRSPSARFLLARASAFSSWARAFIAARSSAVNPLDVLLRAAALFADFCVLFVAGFFSAIARHPFRMSARILDAESDRGEGKHLLPSDPNLGRTRGLRQAQGRGAQWPAEARPNRMGVTRCETADVIIVGAGAGRSDAGR
jgi:hypothetical protein